MSGRVTAKLSAIPCPKSSGSETDLPARRDKNSLGLLKPFLPILLALLWGTPTIPAQDNPLAKQRIELQGRVQEAIKGGNLPEAGRLLQQCLVLQAKINPKPHPDLAVLQLQLGSLQQRMGQHREAQMLADLANLEHTLGHADRAWARYRQAIEIYAQSLGPDSPSLCAPLQHMAHLLIEQGQLPAAQDLLQRALRIAKEGLGPEHPETALILASLGQLKVSMLDLADAQKLLDQSLTLHIRNHGATHPATLGVRGERALLDEIFHKPKAARDAYEFIRRAHADQKREATPTAIRNLMRLARAENLTGQSKTASEYYRQALAAAQKTLGPDHRECAVIRLNHAQLHFQNDNLTEAIALQKQALKDLRELALSDTPFFLSGLNELALCQHRQGRPQAALVTLDELLKRQHHHYQRVLGKLSETEALTYLQGQHRAVGRFQTICALLKDNPDAIRLGAHQLALTKARLEEIRWAQSRVRNDDQPALKRARETLAQIHSATIALERRAASMEPAEVVELRARLATHQRNTEGKLAELALEMDQSIAGQLADRNFTLHEIAQALPADSALVDIVSYQQEATPDQPARLRYAAYITFATDNQDLRVKRVDLGLAAPIHKSVTELNRLMYQRLFASKLMPGALKELSHAIGQPLRTALGPVKRVFLCPDSQLARMPFELLQHGEGFWLDELEISYLGSGREILRLTAPQKARQTSPAVVLGNPAFTGADTAAVRSDTFSPLPYSAKEMALISESLGKETRQITGATATEAALKAVRRPDVLHLSTHAFYLHTPVIQDGETTLAKVAPHHLPTGRLNPLLRCGLALAGANATARQPLGPANDGLFTGQEAADLDLHGTRLVILSACESGVGEIHAGEGALSLRRAFRVAGAEAVLASHWPVSDRATSELMRRFIKHWKTGKPRASALRAAQLELRSDEDLDHPYFWAAFTLMGQWR